MGETFGRYELLELVGKGGMATVHRALQRGPGGYSKPCVVKRIAERYGSNESARRLFMEEARISALLSHQNLVQTFDYGEHDGVPYLAQELVDGPNLARAMSHLVKQGHVLPLATTLEIARCVLAALAYAHDLKGLEGQPLELVHRDVSPHNILLSEGGVVKLTDFGIARHEARDEHTQDKRIKGKPAYMAPEQAMGAPVGPPCDIFSLGVVMAELISGSRVRPKETPLALLDVRPRITQLCRARSGVPDALVELCLAWTAIEPTERPQTAQEALEQASGIRVSGPPLNEVSAHLRQVLEGATPDPQLLPLLTHGGFEPSPAGAADERPDTEGSASLDLWAQNSEGSDASLDLGDAAKNVPEFLARSSDIKSMEFFGAKYSKDAADERGAPEQAVESGEDSAAAPLRLPTFGSQTTAPTTEAGAGKLLTVPGLDDAIAGAAAELAPKKPFTIPAAAYLGLGAVVVAALALGVVALFSADDSTNVDATVGTLSVSSTPPGGRIYINRTDTKQITPHDFTNQPLNQPIHVMVRLARHLSTPPDLTIDVPSSTGLSAASFRLLPGRELRVHSEPSEAFVSFNGHRLSRVTPARLPVLPFGRTATVVIELEDYMPEKLVLAATTDTATITQVKLHPAKRLDISTTPPGATARLNGHLLGKTPLFDVLVPAEGRFWLELRDPAHRGHKKRYRASKLGREIAVELKPRPFLSLPWNREERAQARDLDRKHALALRKMKASKRMLAQAEKTLVRVEAATRATVHQLSAAQNDVSRHTEALERWRTQVDDLASSKDGLRATLMLRREGR